MSYRETNQALHTVFLLDKQKSTHRSRTVGPNVEYIFFYNGYIHTTYTIKKGVTFRLKTQDAYKPNGSEYAVSILKRAYEGHPYCDDMPINHYIEDESED